MVEYLRLSDVMLSDVMLTEENKYTEREVGDQPADPDLRVGDAVWTAKVVGRLHDSGVFVPPLSGSVVKMERKGATASQAMMSQAMMSLRKAAEDQGWELR